MGVILNPSDYPTLGHFLEKKFGANTVPAGLRPEIRILIWIGEVNIRASSSHVATTWRLRLQTSWTTPPISNTICAFFTYTLSFEGIPRKFNLNSVTMSAMIISRPRKRKRGITFARSGRQMRPRRLFAPQRGFLRVGGFYGRYSGRNAELKFFDTLKAQTSVTETGTVLDDSVNHIAQGVTEENRVGRKCTIRGLHFKGTYNNTVSTVLSATNQSVRIVIVVDKQTNGTAVTVADVLEDVTEFNGYNSYRNLANSQRFKVLMDRRFNIRIPAVAQTAAGTFSTYLNEYKWEFNKRLNLPIEFSGTTGAIGEIRSNNIAIFAICRDATTRPEVGYTCRVRFSDS